MHSIALALMLRDPTVEAGESKEGCFGSHASGDQTVFVAVEEFLGCVPIAGLSSWLAENDIFSNFLIVFMTYI